MAIVSGEPFQLTVFTFLFFFNDTATTEIYTLSLHDALPISFPALRRQPASISRRKALRCALLDRKSTRLNSSHEWISYAVFCLKKKKKMDSRWRAGGDVGWLVWPHAEVTCE